MEVKPGYKQTEVGIIPEEWEVKTLGEIGDVRMCKRVLKQQTRSHGDVPFYKIGTFGGVADAYISSSLFEEFRRKYSFPKKGDVLISAAGTIGRSVVFDGASAYFQDSNIVWIENDESKATNEYLWHRYQVTKWAVSHGGTVARLYNDSLRTKIYVPVPPLREQRAIAAALSDVDALLGGLDRLIAKKRDLNQAAMQQLLTGQTRLPGFSGAWEVKRLGEIGSTYGGLTGKTKADFGIGTGRYVTFMNVMANVVIDCGSFEQVRVLPSESQNRVNEGDLLFNGSSETPEEVAMCSFMASDVSCLFLNSFCFGFRRRDERQVDGLFLAYYLRASPGRELMKSLAQGSTRYNLSKGALLEASIRLPLKGEQTAIAAVLYDMDAELAALEARRDKTRDLKQAMMQELLNGKTRLVKPEVAHA